MGSLTGENASILENFCDERRQLSSCGLNASVVSVGSLVSAFPWFPGSEQFPPHWQHLAAWAPARLNATAAGILGGHHWMVGQSAADEEVSNVSLSSDNGLSSNNKNPRPLIG